MILLSFGFLSEGREIKTRNQRTPTLATGLSEIQRILVLPHIFLELSLFYALPNDMFHTQAFYFSSLWNILNDNWLCIFSNITKHTSVFTECINDPHAKQECEKTTY